MAGKVKVKKVAQVEKERLASKASSRSPQTMAELLRRSNYQFRGWQVGEEVEGVVTEKTRRVVYLDIGGKSEGMVVDREFKAAKEFIEQLKVGDKVKAVVTQPENDRGQTLLSLKKAALEHLWQEFEEKLKTGEVVRVWGKEVNKGGLVVEAKGLLGFIPSSQFSSKWMGKIDQLVNRWIEVKVIEVERKKNRLILSEREVSEAELIEELAVVLKKIKKGDVLEGEVSGVMPFGLFVKIEVPRKGRARVVETRGARATPDTNGISLEGLVHISEISWEKVEDPGKFYQVGDRVKAKVLAVDEKRGKLNLSLKQLTPDPWEKIEKKYPPDSTVEGEVVRVAPFGVFVYLEPGIEGLIHISKIPADRSFKVGEKVACFVESIDKEGRRLSLGLVLKEKPVGYK